METFNYNEFRNDVQRSIFTDLPKNVDQDTAYDFVNEWIDNAVIYYADCWAIVNQLCPADWSDLEQEYGEINNIVTLAYCVLKEHVNEDEELTLFIENHLNK